GGEAVCVGARVVELLLRLYAGLLQLIGPLQFDLCVAKLDLEVRDSGLRGVAIGFGGVQGLLGVGVVEGGEKLVFADAGAFVEENACNTASDFGGDRCATPRSNGCRVGA